MTHCPPCIVRRPSQTLRLVTVAAAPAEATHRAAPTEIIRANTMRAFLLKLASPEPLFDFLAPTGWDAQWVDGITRDICRMPEGDDVAKADAAIKFLTGLGLRNRDVENMASSCKPILRVPEPQLRAVVDYLTAQGLSDAALQNFLVRNPQLLTYVPEGDVLTKGRAKASVEVAPAGDGSVGARVHVWRDDARVSEIGIGAWSWGDSSGYWGYNKSYGQSDNLEAFKAAMEAGATFLDTAEVYGFGNSERFIREFSASTGLEPDVATKFGPLPWRQSAGSLVKACKGSLERLGSQRVTLYLQHWPGFFFNAFANDAYIQGLADVVDQGLAQAVGVSNFNADRARGTSLACNQVQYSLLYRAPETNGVLEACREAGSTLVAYSPLCQGFLTGKYNAENKPSGVRGRNFSAAQYEELVRLLDLMRAVGAEEGDHTPAQIAINWLLCKGVLPIPGAKNAAQVQAIVGATGWRLSDGAVAELDKVSARVKSASGAPFENW
ncbi:hypothetical protein APUTEX25_003763 [Auxenochlorella protothecoides]|uniref:NADP-dependent oxidoreductase domain-containing protein n=1 Tax=Auxenochlorella protothecoides TaxID=3075 RepID=A0A3M7L6D4_AUXPR|nr:hypothetical protein APUTEX25_003763 [Auxenochlorella protothecoides]|eukprot:RMZ57520.1 hypothetical protein APUTEX25_003763 [Auxenochlorella protothecoides]